MRVLIIGASGFIGFPVAQALVRAGHIVYGLTRSAEKGRKLAAEEIIPIVAEYNDLPAWTHLIATIDAVIEALGGHQVDQLAKAVFAATVKAATETRPAHAPKLAYICTSGTWVHGHNATELVNDTTPIGVINPPVSIAEWRVPHDQAVVQSTILNGIVIRPVVLYGRSGSLTSMLFKSAYEGKVRWFGKPGERCCFVHQDDLGELYRLVAERSSILKGLTFVAGNDFTESVDDILNKLVEVSGAQGFEYVEGTNELERALSKGHLVRPYLARSLVGWQPRKPGFVDHLGIYYNAWKASQGLV